MEMIVDSESLATLLQGGQMLIYGKVRLGTAP